MSKERAGVALGHLLGRFLVPVRDLHVDEGPDPDPDMVVTNDDIELRRARAMSLMLIIRINVGHTRFLN